MSTFLGNKSVDYFFNSFPYSYLKSNPKSNTYLSFSSTFGSL